MSGEDRYDGDPIQKWAVQLRKGSLDLAILASLWSGRLYGLEILRRLDDDGNLLVPEGTVYPLLSRLKNEGWVTSEWVDREAGHPRKYYQLTAKGRRHALHMLRTWAAFTSSVDRLLGPMRREER